jgi:hypothetical protein
MAEDNIVQRIKRWKSMSKRPIGRPKTHWEDDVLEDIKNINVHKWKKVSQNRDNWKKVVEQARTLNRLYSAYKKKTLQYSSDNVQNPEV